MLGQDVVARLRAADQDVSVSTQADLDITDAAACTSAVEGFDVVVNCAAWTAVDDAETGFVLTAREVGHQFGRMGNTAQVATGSCVNS